RPFPAPPSGRAAPSAPTASTGAPVRPSAPPCAAGTPHPTSHSWLSLQRARLARPEGWHYTPIPPLPDEYPSPYLRAVPEEFIFGCPTGEVGLDLARTTLQLMALGALIVSSF